MFLHQQITLIISGGGRRKFFLSVLGEWSILNEEEENWKDMKAFASYIKYELLFYLRQCQCYANSSLAIQ